MIIVIATPASVPLLITNNCTYSKARSSPEAVTLISIDLVQGLPDVHPAPLELDFHHWDAVDESGHVIAVVTGADDLVLVGDLQGVVVDALLVDQVDVFRLAIVALEHLDMKRLKPDVGQYQGARRMNLHPMTSDSLELLAAARHGVEAA